MAGSAIWRELERRGFTRLIGRTHAELDLLDGAAVKAFYAREKPDYVLILPWNIKDEVMRQMNFIREWGGQFVVPIPEVAVYPAPA